MIGTKRLWKSRETGKFIGSVNVDNTIMDGYIEDNKIILWSNKDIGSVSITLIKENTEIYIYSPFLELYNNLKYHDDIR